MTQPPGGIFRVEAGSRGLPLAHILWLALLIRTADASERSPMTSESSSTVWIRSKVLQQRATHGPSGYKCDGVDAALLAGR